MHTHHSVIHARKWKVSVFGNRATGAIICKDAGTISPLYTLSISNASGKLQLVIDCVANTR